MYIECLVETIPDDVLIKIHRGRMDALRLDIRLARVTKMARA